MRTLACVLLEWYRLLGSPIASMLGARCRYEPSCSTFALDAFTRLSWPRAGWLTLRRLGSCASWGRG